MNTIQEIKAANAALGHMWFSPGAMRCFKTRLCPSTVRKCWHGGTLFVTSEKGPDGVRRYSIRRAAGDGSISTMGEFQGYATSGSAFRALRYAVVKGVLP